MGNFCTSFVLKKDVAACGAIDPAVCNRCDQWDLQRGTRRIPSRCPRNRRSTGACGRDVRWAEWTLCIQRISSGRTMLPRRPPHKPDGSPPAGLGMVSSVSPAPFSLGSRQYRFLVCQHAPTGSRPGLCLRPALTVSRNRALFTTLMQGWWSDDPLVRMRAADATEKVTRKYPDLLTAYKKQLLGLLSDVEQQELRWHLAALVPRLRLSRKERYFAASSLRGYLQDHSSIVKTCALEALANLAKDDSTMRPEVKRLLRQSLRNGTPAMKARSRRLLLRLDSEH